MSNPASTPSTATVEALIAEAKAEMAALDSELEPLLAKRRILQDRLSTLEHLITLYEGRRDESARNAHLAVLLDLDGPAKPARRSGGQGVGEVVCDRVRTILSESAVDSMHILDIHEAFRMRGWPVPGAGSPANITAHISHAPDIYSPKRGFWAVGEMPQASTRSRATRKAGAKPRRSRKSTTTTTTGEK